MALGACLLMVAVPAVDPGHAEAKAPEADVREVVSLRAAPRPADPIPIPEVQPVEPGPVPMPRVHPSEPGPVPIPHAQLADPDLPMIPGHGRLLPDSLSGRLQLDPRGR
jgi:hypothetical protein